MRSERSEREIAVNARPLSGDQAARGFTSNIRETYADMEEAMTNYKFQQASPEPCIPSGLWL